MQGGGGVKDGVKGGGGVKGGACLLLPFIQIRLVHQIRLLLEILLGRMLAHLIRFEQGLRLGLRLRNQK